MLRLVGISMLVLVLGLVACGEEDPVIPDVRPGDLKGWVGGLQQCGLLALAKNRVGLLLCAGCPPSKDMNEAAIHLL